MRILFLHSHTLHTKVTIPLALEWINRGVQVDYREKRRRSLGLARRFNADYIRRHPTRVDLVDPDALDYVSRLINLNEEWTRSGDKIGWVRNPRYENYSAVVGTTKDLEVLRKIQHQHGVPVFALGYQHLPVLARIDAAFHRVARSHAEALHRSLFLDTNPFAMEHAFPSVVRGCDVRFVGFPYMDRVYQWEQSRPRREPENRRQVLVFHPGGYRGVVSAPGMDRGACYERQAAFLEAVCVPLYERGLRPVLKVHPLRARYHDAEDLIRVRVRVAKRRGWPEDWLQILGPEEWYWPAAFSAAFILTFGSSSVYELWMAGLRNVYVVNFLGSARSKKFTIFSGIVLDSRDAYRSFLETGPPWERPCTGLTDTVINAYHELFTGEATRTLADWISTEVNPG